MDAFHDEDIFLVQFHEIAVEITFAFLEIETWDFHFLAVQQIIQLPVEEVQVHGMQGLEVVVAFLVFRCMFAVDEVIVQFDDLRHEAEDADLVRKAFGRRGLSAGGRAGDENDLHTAAAFVDAVGDLCILAFVQGFRHVDQLHDLVVQHDLVQGADAFHAHDVAPVGIFLQGTGNL